MNEGLTQREQDALEAHTDLIGRTGAKSLECGYLHDDAPMHEAGWYAHAQYKGARVTVDDHRSPWEALEALAHRLLDGARCVGCGRLVTLRQEDEGVRCRWRRHGPKWKRGCDA